MITRGAIQYACARSSSSVVSSWHVQSILILYPCSIQDDSGNWVGLCLFFKPRHKEMNEDLNCSLYYSVIVILNNVHLYKMHFFKKRESYTFFFNINTIKKNQE